MWQPIMWCIAHARSFPRVGRWRRRLADGPRTACTAPERSGEDVNLLALLVCGCFVPYLMMPLVVPSCTLENS